MAGAESGAEELHQGRRSPEHILDRLQPISELEERLARQIILCDTRLEHIAQRFARAWRQLRTLDKERI